MHRNETVTRINSDDNAVTETLNRLSNERGIFHGNATENHAAHSQIQKSLHIVKGANAAANLNGNFNGVKNFFDCVKVLR